MIGNRDEQLNKAFGQNLKKTRKGKKLSIRKLALEADMDWSHIDKIEKGEVNPTLSTIYALATALKIDPRELLP